MRVKSKKVMFLQMLLLVFALAASATDAYSQDPTPEESKKRAQEQYREYQARVRQMLLDKGVPFDPDLLFRSDVRETLNPILAKMPEMQVNYFRSEPLEGVIMGGEITLPEKVELVGDTIILAKKLKFTGSKVLIKGTYNFHQYTIEPSSAIDGSRLSITIDTSGTDGKPGKEGAPGTPGKRP
jgi:hypothetical protein